MNHNYFVRGDRNSDLTVIRYLPPLGHRTLPAAKEAKIKEIREEMRFDLETISGFLNDIQKAKEPQHRMCLCCEINVLMDDIEEIRKDEETVRRLTFEDKSL